MDFQILSDLRDQIKECLDASCEYTFFLSLGRPPADCNSIAFWYKEMSRSPRDNTDCITTIFDTDIVLTITRCCVVADSAIGFNFTQEEHDAQCFISDLQALLCCLNDIDVPSISCGPFILEVQLDQERLGGCYSADIVLSLTDELCCPDP